jgi:hypothetical protein
LLKLTELGVNVTLPNPHVKRILQDISRESLEYQPEGYKHTRQVDYDEFAQQVVGETILTILAADHRDLTYTQFDLDRIQAATSRIVDHVRNHWDFR